MNALQNRSRALLASCLTLALFLSAVRIAAAAPGDLDPSFDGDGKVITDTMLGTGWVSMTIDNAGRIIVVGTTGISPNYDITVARYLQDGSLDTSFGSNGLVTTDLGGTDRASDVVTDSFDRIIVVGSSGGDFVLVRYLPNGSLDPAFAGDGTVTTDFGGREDVAQAVVLDGDGRVVVQGETRVDVSTSRTDFALARYNSDGSLDATFGAGGKVTTDFSPFDWGHALMVDGVGRIVVAGTVFASGPYANIGVMRYLPNGLLDVTFDGDGKANVEFPQGDAFGQSVMLDRFGRIVVAGTANLPGANPADMVVVRLNPDGSPDTTFGSGGKVMTDFAGKHDGASGVRLTTLGRILVAGYAETGSTYDFGLVRYNENGSLDPAFGAGGKVITDFDGQQDFGTDLAITRDDRIVVAGGTTVILGTSRDVAVARYFGDDLKTIYLPLVLR